MAFCITNLLKKQTEKLNIDHRSEFQDSKAKTLENCELHLPNLPNSFIIYTDASDNAIAGALMQVEEEGNHVPGLWAPGTLFPRERNY